MSNRTARRMASERLLQGKQWHRCTGIRYVQRCHGSSIWLDSFIIEVLLLSLLGEHPVVALLAHNPCLSGAPLRVPH